MSHKQRVYINEMVFVMKLPWTPCARSRRHHVKCEEVGRASNSVCEYRVQNNYTRSFQIPSTGSSPVLPGRRECSFGVLLSDNSHKHIPVFNCGAPT